MKFRVGDEVDFCHCVAKYYQLPDKQFITRPYYESANDDIIRMHIDCCLKAPWMMAGIPVDIKRSALAEMNGRQAVDYIHGEIKEASDQLAKLQTEWERDTRKPQCNHPSK